MSINFIISGQKTFVEKFPDDVRTEKLKNKLYSLEFSREEGFFLLDIADQYSLPEKIYANPQEVAKRIIKTHYNNKGNTGILMTGLKGTGKSLLLKIIANEMINIGIPVIQINKPFNGEDIFNFIENIGECVLIFDEFGKNYKAYDNGGPNQLNLLSLLDGLGNAKRMHLFTENEVSLISEYLINRPGRVYYHFKFSRLSDSVIREYCLDRSIPEDIILELLDLSTKLNILSFDVISCLVKEWLQYGGKLIDHIDILNITLCKDPKKKDIELLSFVREDGSTLQQKDMQIDRYDKQINITIDTKINGLSKYEHLRALFLNEAIYIKDNIYKFETPNGDKITLKIQSE